MPESSIGHLPRASRRSTDGPRDCTAAVARLDAGVGPAAAAVRRASDMPGAGSLLARDRELGRLRRLIAGAAAGSGSALIIRGDAGSGKSALLSAALTEAPGVTVLPVDGLRHEAEVSYSGLERLLCAARAPAFGAGPDIRFSEDTAARMSYVAVARGLREVLVDLVEQAGPLVLRADDAQWLDIETRRLLASLARRIVDLPIALLMAIRGDVAEPALSALDQMSLTGLGPGHVAELATRLSGTRPSEAVAGRLADSLQGNPEAVTDVVARLSPSQLAGREPLPEPLIVGDRLIDAFTGPVSDLGSRCRRALLLAASVPPNQGLACLQSVLSRDQITLADLYPAEDARLLRLGPAGVEFTHPLVRVAVFSAAAPDERRHALRLLAERVAEAETGAVEHVDAPAPVPDPTTIDLIAEPMEPVRHAGRADQPAAKAATASETYVLQLLGGFSVLLGDEDVAPRQAQPAQAVKLIALRGKLTVDELVEELWPGAEPGVGRVRIRNVLSRVRDACPGLVEREADTLYLNPTVTVDVRDFEHEADSILSPQTHGASPVDDATQALALYTGELLPGDRYATWASAERERLAGRHRELLEVVMDESESAGDTLRAVRLAEEAIALQPYDESLYARAAQLMARLGWRYKALQMLRKAEAVAAELGVAPSVMVRQLQAELHSS